MRPTPLLVAGLLFPAALSAQLPNPSTRALALGGAYTSLARGFEAVSWNPAMLAVSGGRSFTIGLPQLQVEVGSNTYSWQDFRDYANNTLNEADKRYLLDQISLDDSVLTIRTIAGLAPFGLSIGRFGFAVGTSGDLDLSVGRDAIELLLYGNSRRSGPGQFFTAAGSRARGWAASTIAGSLAWPFRLPQGRLSLGVTYKRVTGHFIGRAEELASRFQVNPSFLARAEGHAIYTDYSRTYDPSGPGDVLGGEGKAGSGYGIDVGATIQFAGSAVTLSAVAVNAAGSMTWDAGRLVYERTVDTLTQDASGRVRDTSVAVLRVTPAQIGADPRARALRDSLLANADFARLVRVGVALRAGGLSVAADAQLRLSEGLDRRPPQAISAGAEYRVLRILPIRVGIGWDFGESFVLSGGTGLQLLGLNLDVSAASISGTVRPGAVFSAGVGLMF